ncbi:MAG: tRNA dihydrouridine(20/20a) synthase DusA, partial [Pseudomonadota bacterium]
GCPSDRVQSGRFGACLMAEPELVGHCIAAMKDAVDVPVTIKCRIGVDDQDPGPALDALSQFIWKAGADALWVHARKAWLEGLSPKENRDIPPLDYDRVYRLKQENRSHFIGINGGIDDLNQAINHLDKTDGVMLGRAAYHKPYLLRHVDQAIFDVGETPVTLDQVIETMCTYCEQHLQDGGRTNQITRHMIGLFQGIPGARAWRQILSTQAVKPGAGPEVIQNAYAAVSGNLAWVA